MRSNERSWGSSRKGKRKRTVAEGKVARARGRRWMWWCCGGGTVVLEVVMWWLVERARWMARRRTATPAWPRRWPVVEKVG